MKRISVMSSNLSQADMERAAWRAFEGHSGKREVAEFVDDFRNRCARLYDALMDGSWKEFLSYRQLEKVNKNGKKRNIDSPSLETRIYQHLLLNLLEPIYNSKDNLNGLNCKKRCGITAKDPRRSVIHRMKQAYFDRTDLHCCLLIDQRKCYEHVSTKVFRRALKQIIDDKWLVDFAVDVSFVDGRLPIGTPTSPFVHHLLMLAFDYYVKDVAPFSIRYADDNFMAFHTIEEAQQAKWRVKNYWWYALGLRSKRHTCIIQPMSKPLDFCGYVFYRNENKGVCDHNKGYVKIRESTAKDAKKCDNDRSWGSYFGQLIHADCFQLINSIQENMKLRDLTSKVRIDRTMDARNIEIRELIGVVITIYDYEIRYNSQKQPNWIKCLVGFDEVIDGERTGKTLAREFHGNYQGIIQFMTACEKAFGKRNILPLEEVEIENQCGYIFKGSTNQLTYIEDDNSQ